MRKVFLSICLLLTLTGFSQNKGDIRFDLELLNRHFWRGLQMGNSPAIEPNVTYSYKGFNFSIWAAYTINSSYTEIDLIPSYSFGNFSLTFYDYYNPVLGEENKYFSFSEEENRHSCELALSYNGRGFLPVRFMAGTFVLGDKNPENKRPYYSTYLEFGYPFHLKDVTAEIFAGITPFKGYYADNFAVVSTGLVLKTSVNVSDNLEMPFKFSYLMNPHSSKAFVIFGVGLSKI